MSKETEMNKSTAFYTVPEFAELAGVSKQAVYQRIKKDLKGYTRKEAGVTVISGEALELVGSKVEQAELSEFNFELDSGMDEVEQLYREISKVDQSKRKVDQDNQSSESTSLREYLNSKEGMLDYLISDLRNLRNNIERLQKEIDRLNSIIADKDAKIAEFAERFAGLAEKEQEISSRALATTGQAQMLHAMSEQPEVIDAPQEPTGAEKKRPWWRKKDK